MLVIGFSWLALCERKVLKLKLIIYIVAGSICKVLADDRNCAKSQKKTVLFGDETKFPKSLELIFFLLATEWDILLNGWKFSV